MKISSRTSLRVVALAVGRALADHGIRAVLTGGACASIHAGGTYLSEDVDFVLAGATRVEDLDEAMAAVGFTRHDNRYEHPRSRFWVEFPKGPLAVGGDLEVEPVPLDASRKGALALSPTDSCRDRLAAFYHWSDRQSLAVAVEIAARNELDWDRIRLWSTREGQGTRYEEFRREVERRAKRPTGSPSSTERT